MAATAFPSGNQARLIPAATAPRRSDGATSGKAARLAGNVTSGTSWKW